VKPFRIATFNVWHGLAGRGPLWGLFGFREFESPETRQERWRAALRLLAEIDADVFLLQELNPLSIKGQDLVAALGGHFYGRVDQSGIRFLSLGVPSNLRTGMGILVRGRTRPARLRDDSDFFPKSQKLSGRMGLTGENFSLQFDEQRYAQFFSIQHETLGRILIVNTHLHHGFERFPLLMSLLDEAVEAGQVSRVEVENLLPFLDLSRDRRVAELDRILEVVQHVQKQHDGIIIGGDFNSVPSGGVIKNLELAGFVDVSAQSGNDSPTWDPLKNELNHNLQTRKGFDFPLPDFGNPALREVFQKFDRSPRRIDYIFARGRVASGARTWVFGYPQVGQMGVSDHFGVVAEWS
jgi:endonuclease/exonuclease/phosphatase family metal-dependent hydrolase